MEMTRVFSFGLFETTPLLDLPVEMIANILRFLDPESLLSAAKAYRELSEICRGDPILKKRLRKQIKYEEDLRRRVILEPRIGISVTRQGLPVKFAENIEKKVELRRLPTLERKRKEREIRAIPFRIVPDLKISRSGGPIRRKTNVRTVPYNMIRC